jgi:hypothetical protein
MAKTKISEFSSTPANNTDIDSINIAEGCAPSGINDAIRELMAQLKDFQTGAVGDSFNGPIGTSTAAAGAFTTLSATGAITSTLATGTAPLVIASTTKVANLNVDLLDGADWAAPAALGSTTPAAVSATTLSASSTVTLSGGTANGVAYLNGSKVVTSGSALTFDGTNLTASGVRIGYATNLFGTDGTLSNYSASNGVYLNGNSAGWLRLSGDGTNATNITVFGATAGSANQIQFSANGSEQMRLTSTGLGIGTSSPAAKLDLSANAVIMGYFRSSGGSANDQRLTFTSGGGRVVLDAATNSTGASSAFGFTLGGTEGMRLTTTGLGIGTSAPAFPLDVQSTGTGSNIASRIYRSDGTIALLRIGNSTSGSASSAPAFGSDTTAAVIYTDNAERMRITSPGNLGLGVTPSASWASQRAIQLASNGSVSSSATYPISLSSNAVATSNGWAANYIADGFAALYAHTSGQHRWFTAPSGTAGNSITFTQAMTLDASGNLLVGATSQFGGADCKLQGKNGSSAQAVSFLWNATTTGDANFVAFGTEASVTQRGSITYNRAGGLTVYNTTSDYRAKDITGSVTDSGSIIDSVPVYMGKMKDATQERPMFIAHETPDYAHTGEKDAVDADGNPIYQQMDASALIPVMWAEIQSLRKRLADAGI